MQFINWIGELLLFALYPGSSTFRMTNALQFLQAHYKIFSSVKAKEFAEAAGIPLNVLEDDVTDVLLSILWTDFEKDRLLALGTFFFFNWRRVGHFDAFFRDFNLDAISTTRIRTDK